VLPSALSRVAPPDIEHAWQRLPDSSNDCPGSYDYFPDGGMRNFHCHVRTLVSYTKLQQLAGLAAFRQGPHSRDQLNLRSSTSFGRYDPAFVRWLSNHLIPGPRLRRQTQPIYDKHVRPLARIFYLTHRKLHSSPTYLEQEKARYLKLVRSGLLPSGYLEQYFYFMNPGYLDNPEGGFNYFQRRGFDGGVDGNVVKTCIAFWIRRSIDGTSADFFAGLRRLLAAYDAAFLERPS